MMRAHAILVVAFVAVLSTSCTEQAWDEQAATDERTAVTKDVDAEERGDKPLAEPHKAPAGQKTLIAARGSVTPGGTAPDPMSVSQEQRDAAKNAGVPPTAEVELAQGTTMRFVYIPPGKFFMGEYRDDDEDGLPDADDPPGWGETPAHPVNLTTGFYMGIYEVTCGQWCVVMEQSPSEAPWFMKPFFRSGDECWPYPAEYISYANCQQFLEKLNLKGVGRFRLPTEAEWEYACLARTETKYSFGNEQGKLVHYGWVKENTKGSDHHVHEVGKKNPSPWGLFDMYGNVWEWCHDWYSQKYYRKCPTFPEFLNDPTGPALGDARVLRGGGYTVEGSAIGSRNRWCLPPQMSDYPGVGFRCVMDMPER